MGPSTMDIKTGYSDEIHVAYNESFKVDSSMGSYHMHHVTYPPRLSDSRIFSSPQKKSH